MLLRSTLCRTHPALQRLPGISSVLVPSRCVSVSPRTSSFRLRPFIELARLDKPIGTWLLYWPCAWSLTLAATEVQLPPSSLLYHASLFGIGALVMRGAGCTINDLWDRHIDASVARTKSRPLSSGAITVNEALVFLAMQLTAGLCVLVQLNLYSILLGASSLSIVAIYPLMKRVTYWPQFVLGLAFNWGALLGSSAILGYCNWAVALPLYAGSICWTLVYDTIYAHQDTVDDVKVGVKSTALLFGDYSKHVMSIFSLALVSSLAYVGLASHCSAGYYILSCGGAAAHLAWQLYTVDLNDRASCWSTFAANRDLGLLVFSGMALDFAMRTLV